LRAGVKDTAHKSLPGVATSPTERPKAICNVTVRDSLEGRKEGCRDGPCKTGLNIEGSQVS